MSGKKIFRPEVMHYAFRETVFFGYHEKLRATRFIGESGGGMVKAHVFGNGRLEKLEFDEFLKDKSVEMVEQLVVVAYNDARTKAEQAAVENMKKIQKELPDINEVMKEIMKTEGEIFDSNPTMNLNPNIYDKKYREWKENEELRKLEEEEKEDNNSKPSEDKKV